MQGQSRSARGALRPVREKAHPATAMDRGPPRRPGCGPDWPGTDRRSSRRWPEELPAEDVTREQKGDPTARRPVRATERSLLRPERLDPPRVRAPKTGRCRGRRSDGHRTEPPDKAPATAAVQPRGRALALQERGGPRQEESALQRAMEANLLEWTSIEGMPITSRAASSPTRAPPS